MHLLVTTQPPVDPYSGSSSDGSGLLRSIVVRPVGVAQLEARSVQPKSPVDVDTETFVHYIPSTFQQTSMGTESCDVTIPKVGPWCRAPIVAVAMSPNRE